ncbi:MAG TPA: hypothetical protein VEI97_05320, partial [bacterium]|nr:hypothetical protein [bacterium]
MRSPLWLLAICALAWIPACEQFHEPGPKFPPGPGPDPDPDPDLRPMREIVVEPGATVEAGTTLSFATTGDPLLATDLITWTLTANGDTVNRFPEGSGPVSFPDLARFGTPLAQDASFSVPPMVRPVTPGNYTLRVRETGTGYDPIQRDVPVLVQPAVAMQFRPEATEVTGLPPEGEANALAGILLPAHAVALSEGDGGDGLGELLVVMARQQRVDTASGEIANEFAVYLGHVESGFWSIPIVVSTDPLDRLMETAPPPVLREYGARNLQSFGVHADGREVELAWTDRENTLVYKAATIAANTGAIGFTLGNRVEIADGPLRVVPLRAPDGRA